MVAVTFAWPVVGGKSEAWRRFCQELLGTARDDYAASRRRLGITRETAWLTGSPPREMVILALEADEPGTVLARLACSTHPFDHWFREQLRACHGIDLARLPPGTTPELVLDWRATSAGEVPDQQEARPIADDAQPGTRRIERRQLGREETTVTATEATAMTMTEANKALVRRWIEEIWSAPDLAAAQAAADAIVAEDFVNHNMPPGLPPGREGLKLQLGVFYGAFPDLTSTVLDLVAEGDRAVARWSSTVTHTGDFLGIPPTGRQGIMTGTAIVRIADGLIAEHWSNSDDLGLMKSLGIIP